MARLHPAEYVALGRRAIVELLDQENAAAWREIEAKIADQAWSGLTTGIDPNHLSTARRELLKTGQIEEVENTSRGGREVSIVVPVGGRRQTAINKAVARKSLLLTRYLGWASGTATAPASTRSSTAKTDTRALDVLASHVRPSVA